MVSKMGGTIYLNFSGLAYTLLIMLIFFIKPKTNSKEQKIYGLLIINSFFELLFGLLSAYAIYYRKSLFYMNITGRFFLVSMLIWVFLFTIYIINISRNCNQRSIFRIISVVFSIFIVLVFILPLNYVTKDNLIYSEGLANIFTYLFAFVCIFICIILGIKNIKEKDRRFLPLWVFITFGVGIMVLQMLMPSVFLIVPFEIFITSLMYHTIENPDLKIIEELKKNRSLTSKSYIEKSNFLFRMSAEVRKPIENIKELNDYNLDSDNLKEIKENSKGIDLNLRNANFTINNVLDVTSLDTKNINIIDNKYSIIKLLNEIKLRESKKINNIRFDFNISENIPEYLYGDSIRLKNILMCILDKSIERTNTGFIEVNVNSINKYDICRLIITIEDSSLPLSLEEINNILDNDKEIDENNITIYDINKLINMMNGNLMIKSEEGNEFLLSIDSKILNPKTEEITNDTDILFISNNNKLLKNLEILFNEYTSNSVLNGIDAIDLIRAGENYNLILIDDVMKPISGLETLKKLRSLDINIPCIIMLDNDKEHIKNHYIKDGFIDYILKDDLKNEINRIIKEML